MTEAGMGDVDELLRTSLVKAFLCENQDLFARDPEKWLDKFFSECVPRLNGDVNPVTVKPGSRSALIIHLFSLCDVLRSSSDGIKDHHFEILTMFSKETLGLDTTLTSDGVLLIAEFTAGKRTPLEIRELFVNRFERSHHRVSINGCTSVFDAKDNKFYPPERTRICPNITEKFFIAPNESFDCFSGPVKFHQSLAKEQKERIVRLLYILTRVLFGDENGTKIVDTDEAEKIAAALSQFVGLMRLADNVINFSLDELHEVSVLFDRKFFLTTFLL